MVVRIQQWLAPPNPFMNLHKSLDLRSGNTGQWFLQEAKYDAWKAGTTPFMWRYGSVGCGKTILSSGIIQDMQNHCVQIEDRSLAFYFFDFNDDAKQNSINMLKSILSRLLYACTGIPSILQSLCNHGRQASEQELLAAFKETFELLPAPFIIIDALDECVTRDSLSKVLEEVHGWGHDSLRMMVTSRMEVDIEDALQELIPPESRVCLQSHMVDIDIRTYVKERLSSEPAFRRRHMVPVILEEIQETLGR